MLLEHGEHDSIGKMKQFATYFTHGIRGGAHLRASIYQSREAGHILDLVDRFFAASVSDPAPSVAADDQERAHLALA